MKQKIIAMFVMFSLMIPGAGARAGDDSVPEASLLTNSLVISQLQVSGLAGANDEFIELVNSSDEVINLATWSVQYKSASGSFPLTAKKNLPDIDLNPGQYFLVAHSVYSGPVLPDVTHSSFTLSGAATGATVFLSNSTQFITSSDSVNIIDQLAYGTAETNYPLGQAALLPESGFSLMRIKYEQNNSTDFIVQESAPRNSTSVAPIDDPEPIPTPTPQPTPTVTPIPEPSPTISPTPTPVATPTPATTPTLTPTPVVNPEYSTSIKISEFLPNPTGIDSGNEWIELFNDSSQAVDLSGWVLIDNATGGFTASSVIKLSNVTIEARSYLQIAIPTGKFALNNSGSDSVKLFWPNGELVDEVEYSEPIKENQTWCLINDDYQWCQPTPGVLNVTLVQVTPTPTPNASPTPTVTPTPTPSGIDYSSDLIKIVELMPDPVGPDSGKEYIVLYNAGSTRVDLSGWILDDGAEEDAIGSSALTMTSIILNSGEEYKVVLPSGSFAMDNAAGDTVRLFNPNKELVDVVSYDKSQPILPYVKTVDGWEWGAVRTSNESGEVLGETLPRTGMVIRYWVFATIPAIWYITGKLTTIIKQYEQTGSHRSISCQIGRGQNGSGKIIRSIRGSCN